MNIEMGQCLPVKRPRPHLPIIQFVSGHETKRGEAFTLQDKFCNVKKHLVHNKEMKTPKELST